MYSSYWLILFVWARLRMHNLFVQHWAAHPVVRKCKRCWDTVVVHVGGSWSLLPSTVGHSSSIRASKVSWFVGWSVGQIMVVNGAKWFTVIADMVENGNSENKQRERERATSWWCSSCTTQATRCPVSRSGVLNAQQLENMCETIHGAWSKSAAPKASHCAWGVETSAVLCLRGANPKREEPPSKS